MRIFPLGRKGVKFCGKRQCSIFYNLPQNEGKTTAERVGFSLKASPQNAAGTDILPYVKFYPAAFSIGGEKKALRRSTLIQGKTVAHSRIITAFQVTTNSTAEKACQARKSSFLRWARTRRT